MGAFRQTQDNAKTMQGDEPESFAHSGGFQHMQEYAPERVTKPLLYH
jgi:hypothetical protein